MYRLLEPPKLVPPATIHEHCEITKLKKTEEASKLYKEEFSEFVFIFSPDTHWSKLRKEEDKNSGFAMWIAKWKIESENGEIRVSRFEGHRQISEAFEAKSLIVSRTCW